MPNGIDCLRDPDLMDEEECTAWCQHARMDSTDSDTQPNMFQFLSAGPAYVKNKKIWGRLKCLLQVGRRSTAIRPIFLVAHQLMQTAWSCLEESGFLMSISMLMDKATNLLLGGPYGVILVIVILLKACWTATQLAEGTFLPYLTQTGGPFKISAMERFMLEAIVIWVVEHIQTLTKLLQAPYHPEEPGDNASNTVIWLKQAELPVSFALAKAMIVVMHSSEPAPDTPGTTTPDSRSNRPVVQDEPDAAQHSTWARTLKPLQNPEATTQADIPPDKEDQTNSSAETVDTWVDDPELESND
ncbi:hypothetical protein BDV93DRAFT_509273 [Ceratobasidium sp. AG-I]|nr:hypothetical protein BDV93DRAFT_509273 [Ceratobasidium sp. AG-I]